MGCWLPQFAFPNYSADCMDAVLNFIKVIVCLNTIGHGDRVWIFWKSETRLICVYVRVLKVIFIGAKTPDSPVIFSSTLSKDSGAMAI